MKILWIKRLATAVVFAAAAITASAQKYSDGLIDKTVAVVGNEVIMLSDLEEEVAMMRAYGMMSDKKGRCEILEEMMATKLFLMQSRLDSLAVNNDMVFTSLNGVNILTNNATVALLSSVVLQQVCQHSGRSQVVNSNDIVTFSAKHLTECQTANSTKTINCNSYHNFLPSYYMYFYFLFLS